MSWKSISGRDKVPAETGAPFGISLGIGAVAVVAAVTAAALVPAADQGWRFGIVATVVGGFAALTGDTRAVAPTIVVAWLLVDGFLENRLGVLSWHGRRDLASTAVLMVAGAVGLVLGWSHRYMRDRRSHKRLDSEFRALVAHSVKYTMPTLFEDREEHDA